MRQKGYAAMLPLIIFVIVVVLGVGSFMYTHPGFSLYDLYNIGSPNVTPAPVEVMVDKSNFVTGEILVAFQTGTTYKAAKEVFAKYEITDYENIILKSSGKEITDDLVLQSTDIFEAHVAEGKENELVTRLKAESSIRSATLNYSGAR